MQRTFATRLPPDAARDSVLAAYAALYGRAERTLFARLRAGRSLAATKREFLVRFGLTARQFNALAASLRGNIQSIQARRPGLINTLERRIDRARRVLAMVPQGTRTYHQKQRRLGALQRRLTVLQTEAAVGSVRLCFGSRTLFRRQFALAANGYASHDAWRREWRAARASQFFVLGSKDETAGCQGASLRSTRTARSCSGCACRMRAPASASTWCSPGCASGTGTRRSSPRSGATCPPTRIIGKPSPGGLYRTARDGACSPPCRCRPDRGGAWSTSAWSAWISTRITSR